MSVNNNYANVRSVRNEYKVINKQGKDARTSVEEYLANPLQVIKAYNKTPDGRAYFKALGYNPTKVHLSDFAGYMVSGRFARPVTNQRKAERLYKQGRLFVDVDALGCVSSWYEILPNTVASFAWVLSQIERYRKAEAINEVRQMKAKQAKIMPTNRKLPLVVWLKYQDAQKPMAQLLEEYNTYVTNYTQA